MKGERPATTGTSAAPRASAHRAWILLPVVAAITFLLLAGHAARVETPTVDEFAHVSAGCAYWEYGTLQLYGKNPPLLKYVMSLPLTLRDGVQIPEPKTQPFGWGPWQYGFQFMSLNRDRYLDLFFMARLVVVALTVLTALPLFLWLRQLYDVRAASVSTALFLLSPTVLAHGHLATLDAGCMLTIFLSVFALRRAYVDPGAGRVALAGVVWGLALLVKFTAVLLLPAFVVLIAVYRWKNKLSGAGELAALVAAALVTINVGMGLQGTLRFSNQFSPTSSFGQTVQSVWPQWLPVPLPVAYVTGFDAQMTDVEGGEFGSYLLGEWSPQGWWYYDLVAFAVKTPVPLLLMLAASAWFLLRRRLPRHELLTILLPLGVLLVMMAGFNRLNIGIRYLLPLFPFLFLLTGSLWRHSPRRFAWAVPGAVVAYYLVTVFMIRPHFLSYFNLAAGGASNGHNVLLDSNIDWGQDLYRVPAALQEMEHDGRIGLLYFGHVDPALYDIDYELVASVPESKLLAVSVSYLMGQSYPAMAPDMSTKHIEAGHLDWLRSHEPVLRLGSIWFFDTRKRIEPTN